MISCPTCNYPMRDNAVHCEKCGAEIAAGAPPEATAHANTLRPSDPLAAAIEIREDVKGVTDFAPTGPTDDPIPSPPVSQCDDLDIRYNSARIFVEGMILPFDFQITPKTDGISDICIEIRCGEYARVSDEPPEEPAKDLTMPVHLAFRAPAGQPGGRYPFEIYVGYKKEDKQHWYVARQIHTIYSAGQNAGKVIDNVRIEIQNTIDQGHAGDIHLNQGLSDYLSQLKTSKLDHSVEQLARFDLPYAWATLSLFRCRKQSWQERFLAPSRLPTPPPEACRMRLTLHHKKVKWHLLSETSFRLGRNRKFNDIATRFGHDHIENNQLLSRYHCRIERDGNDWRVLDGGYNPEQRDIVPSSCHTYLDGKQIDLKNGETLTPGREHALSLGTTDLPSGRRAFVLKIEVVSWDEIREDERMMLEESARDAQSPPALILRSPHMPKEVFAVISHILPVRRLDPKLHSLCLIRRTEAFQVCGQGTDCTWLTPGRDARLLHETFSASDYDQSIVTQATKTLSKGGTE